MSLSDGVMAGVPASPAWGGTKISMKCEDKLFSGDAKENRETIFGAVDCSKLEVSYQSNFSRTPNYWSVDVNGGFVPDVPVVRTTYGGVDAGAHAWKFAVDEL